MRGLTVNEAAAVTQAIAAGKLKRIYTVSPDEAFAAWLRGSNRAVVNVWRKSTKKGHQRKALKR